MKKKLSLIFVISCFLEFFCAQVSAEESTFSCPATARKKRIAVLTSGGIVEFVAPGAGRGLAQALGAQLVSSIIEIQGHCFVILERDRFIDIVREIEAAEAGVTHDDKRLKTALQKAKKLYNVDYFIRADVTEYSLAASGQRGSLGGIIGILRLFFGGSKEQGTVKIAMDVRVISTESGEILTGFRVEGQAESSVDNILIELTSATNGGGVTFSQGKFENAPVGAASRQALRAAARGIREQLTPSDIPTEPKVAKVVAGQVYLTGGRIHGWEIHDRLKTFTIAEEILHPDDNTKVLGTVQIHTGTIELVNVENYFSTGTLIGELIPNPGDLIERIAKQTIEQHGNVDQVAASPSPTAAPVRQIVRQSRKPTVKHPEQPPAGPRLAAANSTVPRKSEPGKPRKMLVKLDSKILKRIARS